MRGEWKRAKMKGDHLDNFNKSYFMWGTEVIGKQRVQREMIQQYDM